MTASPLRLITCPRPAVAALNGLAFAGGLITATPRDIAKPAARALARRDPGAHAGRGGVPDRALGRAGLPGE